MIYSGSCYNNTTSTLLQTRRYFTISLLLSFTQNTMMLARGTIVPPQPIDQLEATIVHFLAATKGNPTATIVHNVRNFFR